jgi:hypothetical protein
MSNQRKDEFIYRNLHVQSFWGGHGKILPNSWLVLKGVVCPDFCFSKPVEFPTVVTRKSLTVWSHTMDHRKHERVVYRNGIWIFWNFDQSETQKFSSVQPLLCPETEFSSDVDLQNSLTSKLFVGWGWISNQWKSGRVAHLFGIKIKGRSRCSVQRAFSCSATHKEKPSGDESSLTSESESEMCHDDLPMRQRPVKSLVFWLGLSSSSELEESSLEKSRLLRAAHAQNITCWFKWKSDGGFPCSRNAPTFCPENLRGDMPLV